MRSQLIHPLQKIVKWQWWLASTVLSTSLTLPIVALMQWLLGGNVSKNYLITGFVVSLIIATAVSGLIIYFLSIVANLNLQNIQLNNIINACPIPLIVNNHLQEISMINPEFIKKFGYSPEDIPTISDWWLKAYPDLEYRQSLLNSWRQRSAHANQTAFEPLEVNIHCKNGSLKTAITTAIPLDDHFNGSYLLVFNDVTVKNSLLNAPAESSSILQSIIETIPLRLFWKDQHSRYLGCNTLFAKDAGKQNVSEVIGALDTELSWRDHAVLYQADDQQIINADATKLNYEEPQIKPDGRTVMLRTYKVPLKNNTGDIVGVLGVYDDITQMKQIENELQINRERLNFALLGANDGLWDWNLDTDEVYFSPRWKSMLGYENDSLENTLETWRQLIKPDCRDGLLAIVEEYITGRRNTYEMELQMRHKDGHWVDILSRAKLATDSAGAILEPRHLVGTHVDISDLKQVESALRTKEGYLRALIDSFPCLVWLKDTKSQFLAINQALANNLGEIHPDNVIGKTDFDYAAPEIAAHYQNDDQDVMHTGLKKVIEEEHVDHLGVKHWIESFKAPVFGPDGGILGTVGFARDITDRKTIEEDLRIAATAFESQEGMIVTDANSMILKINQSFTRITGYTSDEAVGHKMKLLKSGVHDARFYKAMWESISNTGSWQGEIWNKRKNGDIYPEWLTITAVKDANATVTHYVGTMIDITARKAIEERVQHLAHYDVLTNLPNRALLTDRLHQSLAQVRREKANLALIFLDLDHFKPVNDTLGHDVGDLLLQAVAARLQLCVKRETDTVSRIGGDEFVIILSHIKDTQDAALVSEEIIQSLSQPFEIGHHSVNISCSIGIAIYPIHGMDIYTLMRVADTAMYEAKRAGRGCFRFYAPDISHDGSPTLS